MEKLKNKLHQFLGKLFYAVAMADKKIEEEEITALKTDILQRWCNLDSKPNGLVLDGHQEIMTVFKQLQSTKAESDICFSEFNEFFNEHKQLFNEDLRKLIWDTTQVIASSFANKNKSELILLAKLKMLLET
jgi:hypothetical protein